MKCDFKKSKCDSWETVHFGAHRQLDPL
jgi:hypothetical protein